MMKITSYLLRPIKYLLFLLAIALLVYFRHAIFQPHINQYVDDSQAFIENKLDISIPVYRVEATMPRPQLKSEIPVTDALVVTNELQEDCNSQQMSNDMVKVDDAQSVDNIMDETEQSAVNQKPVESVIESGDKAIAVHPVVSSGLIEKLTDTVDKLNVKVETLLDDLEKYKTMKSDNNAQPLASDSIIEPEADSVEMASVDQVLNDPESNTDEKTDVRMLLSSARKSYWRGDSQAAEKIYLDLVGMDDTNPDLYGELGNVYYAQGKWEDAGKAYYEAAVRLLALKDNTQVQYLLQVIQGLDSESATKLRQIISGSSIE